MQWTLETEMDIGHWRQKLTLDIRDSNGQWILETAMDNVHHWTLETETDIGIGDSNGQRTYWTQETEMDK